MECEVEDEVITKRDGPVREKQLFTVHMTAPSGATIELDSGTTVLGRGPKFGIPDRRVSRKHAEVTVSKETNTVTLMSVRFNLFHLLVSPPPLTPRNLVRSESVLHPATQ
jgi:pSer/pThr/pTyr-binding forkhead associated (FHA) protein